MGLNNYIIAFISTFTLTWLLVPLNIKFSNRISLIDFPHERGIHKRNIPIAGGGYFRLFPIWFTKWAWKRFHRGHSAPFIFYLHPWEIDPEQPKVKGISLKSRFRHYLNLNKTEDRLKVLLREVRFRPFRYLTDEQWLPTSDEKLGFK